MKWLVALPLLLLSFCASSQNVNDKFYKSYVKSFLDDVLPKTPYKQGIPILRSSTFGYRKPPAYIGSTDINPKYKIFKWRYRNVDGPLEGLPYAIDSIKLSFSEASLLQNYFRRPAVVNWSDEHINGALFIDNRTVDSILEVAMKEQPLVAAYLGPEYFEMSAPLFLRDNSIAIFYWGHLDTVSGWGRLCVYTIGKNGWEEFAEISFWES